MSPSTRAQATLKADPESNEMTVDARKSSAHAGGKRKSSPPASQDDQPKTKTAKKTESAPTEEDRPMADASNGHANGHSNGHSNDLASDEKAKSKATNVKANGHKAKPEAEVKSTNGAAKSQTTSDAPSNVATDYSDEPSTLEKGILYFFFRPRVDFDTPTKLAEVQRGFIVLRPLSGNADLPDGPLGEAKNLRLLVIPKKSLPHKGGRLLSFVEAEKTTTSELKESFLTEIINETKTMGTRVTGAPVPIAEGVYSLIHTNKTTHFVYMTTVPSDMGSVQTNFGIHPSGSFAVSVRNPSFESPAYARLPETAQYPKELIEEFQTLRWLPLHPKFLDYKHCEILFIGEKQDVLPSDGEKQDDRDLVEAEEELKELEEEDEQRVEHLKKDAKVFEDLKMQSEEYGRFRTEW